MSGAIQVEGLSKFLRATSRAEKGTKKRIQTRFRAVGEIVRRDATARISTYDAHTAGGYRVRVRQRGVEVEQRLRRTTGKRGDWGALQMDKGLIPAAEQNANQIRTEFQKALDELASEF